MRRRRTLGRIQMVRIAFGHDLNVLSTFLLHQTVGGPSKNGPNPTSFFVYFQSIDKTNKAQICLPINEGVLGTRTRGGRMVGADESTELWRHPLANIVCGRRPKT